MSSNYKEVLRAFVKDVEVDTERALHMVALQGLDDSINEAPRPRIETGFLRQSAVVEKVGQDWAIEYNAPYAAFQHDLIEPKTSKNHDPKAGAGFLIPKMYKNLNKYIKVVRKYFK